MDDNNFERAVIPKRKKCYDFDLRDASERRRVFDEIPHQEIGLYHLGGSQWSIDPDGEGKRVEDAAVDYFKRKGYRNIHLSYITTAIITCALSSVAPKSRLWKTVTKGDRRRYLVTPRMYDEGYSLSVIWEDTPPRILDADKEVIRQHIAGLGNDFTGRDALLQIGKGLKESEKRDKTTLLSAITTAIDNSSIPQRQQTILKAALAVFGKHVTKSELKNEQILGSVFHSFDAEKIIQNAYEVGLDEFEKCLPMAKSSIDAEDINWRNRGWWLSYRSGAYNVPAGDRLKLNEFVASPLLEETGRKIHGDRWDTVGLNTDTDFLDLCTKIFVALGPERLMNYAILDLWRFVRTQNVSGQSDLVMWDGNNVCFIEVKSPNDKIQNNQLDRFNSVMRPADLNYFIANVRKL